MENIEELKKQLELYKAQVETLKKEKEEQALQIYKLNEELNAAILTIQNYEEKYAIEKTRRFISKSEKLKDITINEVEETINEENKKEKRKSNKGKKYKIRTKSYEKYVTETKYIYPSEEVCPNCGKKLIDFSNSSRYVVEVIPAKVKFIKVVKVNRKCCACNKENNAIFYPVSNENMNGSILTPSLAAFIAYHKYDLGIPFNHLSEYLTNCIGFEINKQNLANYMAKTSKILEPIYDRMTNDLINSSSKVIHSDETTLVVSKKNEENKDRKKSYVYVYSSSYYDEKQIRIYDFHESRSIEATSKLFENFNGIIECDDYAGYDALKKSNENIKLQRCWAHVRRRFADIVKNLKSKDKASSKAYKILCEISKLFAAEERYKKNKLIPSEIVKQRQENVPKIKETLYDLIYNSNPAPKSKLEEAINYAKGCWKDLFTFVDNGYVELSNNIAERAVKPFVIQRKVFQTSGSYAGARYTGKLFSIVQTCKINNINVIDYFEYVLNNINKVDINELMPYSINIKAKLSNKI